MGTNARMVVRDEVRRGMARVFPASKQASRLSCPPCMRVRTSSATTMPLSTNIPRAIMDEAMETRSSSTPKNLMTISPKSMVIGTNEPTISPVRIPKKIITTTSTIVRVW